MERVKKYRNDLCVQLLNIIVTAFCVVMKNEYVLGLYMLLMIFIVFFLFTKRYVSLGVYSICCIVMSIVFELVLFAVSNTIDFTLIGAYAVQVFSLVSSAYIRKKMSGR